MGHRATYPCARPILKVSFSCLTWLTVRYTIPYNTPVVNKEHRFMSEVAKPNPEVDPHVQREYNARLALLAVGLNLERNPQDHWTRREFGSRYHIRHGGQMIEGAGDSEYE